MSNINFLENEVIEFKKTTGELKVGRAYMRVGDEDRQLSMTKNCLI